MQESRKEIYLLQASCGIMKSVGAVGWLVGSDYRIARTVPLYRLPQPKVIISNLNSTEQFAEQCGEMRSMLAAECSRPLYPDFTVQSHRKGPDFFGIS